MVTHHLTSRHVRVFELLIELRLAADDVVRKAVAHGQWVAADTIGGQEPALEVERPDVIGVRRLRQLTGQRTVESRLTPTTLDQSVAVQDRGNGAARRRTLQPVLTLEDVLDLL